MVINGGPCSARSAPQRERPCLRVLTSKYSITAPSICASINMQTLQERAELGAQGSAERQGLLSAHGRAEPPEEAQSC